MRSVAGVAVVAFALTGATSVEGQNAATVVTIAGSPSGTTTNSFAGFRDGDAVGQVINGVGDVAQFNQPVAVAGDPDGKLLFIADKANDALRKFDLEKSTIETVQTFPGLTPVDVMVDASTNLYLLTQTDGFVRMYDRHGNFLKIANDPGVAMGGPMPLTDPTAMTLDLGSNLLVLEKDGDLKKITTSSGLVADVALVDTTDAAVTLGTPPGGETPQGVAVLDNGVVVVSDTANHVLRYFTWATNTANKLVQTNVVGKVAETGRTLGGADVVRFNFPGRIAAAGGNIAVVTDSQNHRVVTVASAGNVELLYGIDPAKWMELEALYPDLSFELHPGWEDGDGELASSRVPGGVTVLGDGTVVTSELYYNIIRKVENTGLTGPSGTSSGGVANPPDIAISPTSGYFPAGVDITVTTPADLVFYRTDGQEASTNDTQVVMNSGSGTIKWFDPLRDLTSLNISAFNIVGTNLVATNITGIRPGANTISVSSNLKAGNGSTIVAPVKVDLAADNEMRSLQYRVLIQPDPTHPDVAMIPEIGFGDLKAITGTTNDFVQFKGVSDMVVVPFNTRAVPDDATNVRILEVFYLAPEGFLVTDFAVVNLLQLELPTQPGGLSEPARYVITIDNASATSDGVQQDLTLNTDPAGSVLTIENIEYLVGDTAPGRWYNAQDGQFGDGDLRNNDVNNAFLASLGIRVPYTFTDAFDAMDSFPSDAIAPAGSSGGDGAITINDWALTLERSLRSDTVNYLRTWTAAGTRTARSHTGAIPIPNLPAQPLTPLPGDIWSPEAQLQGRNVGEAQPDGIVHVPVAIRLNSDAVVEGLQFKAVIRPEGDAPPLEEPVSFVSNIAPPTYTASRAAGLGYGIEEYAAGWLNLNISDSTTFGFLKVRVPATAAEGDCYRVSFKYGSMIVDNGQSGDMETVSACVRVLKPADEQAVLSDEWVNAFFPEGDSTITAAHMDADGDGLSNLEEFLAGTNPADSRSKLEIRGAASGEGDMLHMDFVSAPDKVYVIEGTDDLAGGVWQTIETVVGDGSVKQMVKSIPDGISFYRIRLID